MVRKVQGRHPTGRHVQDGNDLLPINIVDHRLSSVSTARSESDPTGTVGLDDIQVEESVATLHHELEQAESQAEMLMVELTTARSCLEERDAEIAHLEAEVVRLTGILHMKMADPPVVGLDDTVEDITAEQIHQCSSCQELRQQLRHANHELRQRDCAVDTAESKVAGAIALIHVHREHAEAHAKQLQELREAHTTLQKAHAELLPLRSIWSAQMDSSPEESLSSPPEQIINGNDAKVDRNITTYHHQIALLHRQNRRRLAMRYRTI